MRAFLAYLKRLGIATDEWLSVLTGGALHETISLRVAIADKADVESGHPNRPACWVCAYLSRFVEKNHCAKQIAGCATSPQAMLLAGLQLAAAWAVIAWILLHIPPWVIWTVAR